MAEFHRSRESEKSPWLSSIGCRLAIEKLTTDEHFVAFFLRRKGKLGAILIFAVESTHYSFDYVSLSLGLLLVFMAHGIGRVHSQPAWWLDKKRPAGTREKH